MIANNVELLSSNTISSDEESYSIPIDISDIISICREYNKLGWQIQSQVESILELGINEAIQTGNIKKESLPHIKNFLQAISNNVYFGDSCAQAEECIFLIKEYEDEHKVTYISNKN